METFGDGLNTVLTVVCLIVCFLAPLPVFLWLHISKVLGRLDKRKNRQQYGIFHRDLRTNLTGLATPAFFFLRRIWISVVLFLFRQNAVI